ncbi:STM4012 family radical SAM protein [Pseudanabaenaceae cyanobacterium LEGE 13415]|nr:STM4012 family radical SAM protein [Pseudanabaenaceae cyanobacterium LEGE 13415]
MNQSPYQTYVYSYPHKTAYRELKPRSLSEIWATENKNALFLYIHIPFCEMRCGFCNLFTTVSHNDDFVSRYVAALQRQANQVKSALGEVQFARFALGGGTPTQLSIEHLESVLNVAESMGAKLSEIPGSVEVSPETATDEKLKLLRDRGLDRISIGVQSFVDSEVLATQRRQTSDQVKAALTRIRAANFPNLNIDLIYGLPGQTVETWLHSLKTALVFEPEEVYLYPLYIRPLTGLGISDREWDDIRLACYRTGRDFLRANGYTQVSMRMFRSNTAPEASAPVYCCQADGMVGLGCGARSYTRSLHYSNDYAVNSKEIKNIIEQYNSTEDFTAVNYGFELDVEEQKRRFILISVLSEEGLNLENYRDRFHSEPLQDFPQLQGLIDLGLVHDWKLTELGLERSDTFGAWLFSNTVQFNMSIYSLK